MSHADVEGGDYSRILRRKYVIMAALTALLLLLIVTSLSVGTASLTLKQSLNLLTSLLMPGTVKGISRTLTDVVIALRLPRVLMAVAAGASFGIAGALLQTVLKNPLASPYTVGVASSAAFGAALAIILGAGVIGWGGEYITYVNPYAVAANAFLFSMVSAAVVSALALIRGATPGVTILAGVSMTYLFSAATSLLQYFGSSQQIAALVFWMFGDLGKASYPDVWTTAAVVTASAALTIALSKDYNALLLKDEVVTTLGINVRRVRSLTIVIASLLTAVPTAFVGTIGFIGLLAPHIARFLVGADHRYLIPSSALVGASLLLSADTASRTIASPLILPVGVLTAFMGVPLFLYLLFSRGGRFW